jgi:hypothetical protein
MNVFLSYSHRDKDAAADLAARLKQLGFGVWRDDWVLVAGDNLNKKLEEGMRASDFIIVFSRTSSYSSPNLMFELGMAYALKKRVVPVIIDDGGSGDVVHAFAHIVYIRANSLDEAMPKLAHLKNLQLKD